MPVQRQLGGALGGRAAGPLRVGGQGSRQGAVQAVAFPWQQVGVNDFLQQRVAEGVAVAGRVGHQYLAGHQVAQCLQQRPLLQRTGGGEQPVVHAPAGCRGDPRDFAGRTRQDLDPG